jgi:hypothetical protein
MKKTSTKVPIKTPEQQSGLVLHRTRHLFIRCRILLTAKAGSFREPRGQFGPGLSTAEERLGSSAGSLLSNRDCGDS